LFFLQLCHLVSSSRCFLFFEAFPNVTCSKLSYCCSTCSPVKGTGGSLFSTLLLKLTLFRCHLWPFGKNWDYPCNSASTHISTINNLYPYCSMDMQTCLLCSN